MNKTFLLFMPWLVSFVVAFAQPDVRIVCDPDCSPGQHTDLNHAADMNEAESMDAAVIGSVKPKRSEVARLAACVRTKKWRIENPQRYLETKRKYRDANRERALFLSKRWAAANPEKCLQASRRSYVKNKAQKQAYAKKNHAKLAAYHSEWRKKNREYLRSYRKRLKERSPNFSIRCALASRISNALRRTCAIKSVATMRLVGCSIDFLRSYIEARFLPGMSWERRSEWHIDHITPCSFYDLREPKQQLACFHYSNLRPLWKRDNLSKNNKVPSQHQPEFI